MRVHAQDVTKPANDNISIFFYYLLHFLCGCLRLAVALGLIYIYRCLLSDITCAIGFSSATESILMQCLFIEKFEYFFGSLFDQTTILWTLYSVCCEYCWGKDHL